MAEPEGAYVAELDGPDVVDAPTAAAPAAASGEVDKGHEQWMANEKRRQEIEHARMLKAIKEAAPPIPQDPERFRKQMAYMEEFDQQAKDWRQKTFMPDPILAAALERVNQLERENPTPFRPFRET